MLRLSSINIKLGKAQKEFLLYVYEQTKNGNEMRLFDEDRGGFFNSPFPVAYGAGNVYRIIKSLEDKGLIKIYKAKGKKGEHASVALTPKGLLYVESILGNERSEDDIFL